MLTIVLTAVTTALGTGFDDVESFAAQVERSLERRAFVTEYVETVWDGAIIAEEMRWEDGSWWIRSECTTAYFAMNGRHSQSEYLRPRSLPDVTITTWQPGQVRSLLTSPGDSKAYVTILPQFIHPGFNEFAMWFNLAHDRYEGGIFPPLISSIVRDQVLDFEDDGEFVRCRFYRIDPDSRQIEILARKEPFEIASVTHYYANKQWTGSFDERTAAKLEFVFGEYREFDDGLVLPTSARLDSYVREQQTDAWDSEKVGHDRDSVLYSRLSAQLVSEEQADTLAQAFVIPADARIHDTINRMDYALGSREMLVDGARYVVPQPVDRIISGEELSELLTTAELAVGEMSTSPAGGAAPVSGGVEMWRIVLIALLAGLGLGLFVHYFMRLTSRSGVPQ